MIQIPIEHEPLRASSQLITRNPTTAMLTSCGKVKSWITPTLPRLSRGIFNLGNQSCISWLSAQTSCSGQTKLLRHDQSHTAYLLLIFANSLFSPKCLAVKHPPIARMARSSHVKGNDPLRLALTFRLPSFTKCERSQTFPRIVNVVDIASSQARNNRDSPFLRLPPEIRNRIYHFCLGKRVIHISTTTCEKAERGSYSKNELHGTVKASPSPLFVKFVHVICDRSVDAERNIWGNSEDTNQPEVPSYYAYYARHSQCTEALKCGQKKRATHNLPMSLIRACRDIHREASLIPYANNTFAFGNVAELELFITRSLLAPQRAAIKTLQIYGHMAFGPRKAPKMLRGLQTLEVVSPLLLNEEVGPRGLSQIADHYGPFQMSGRDLETVWVNYPKDIGPGCREQLRELADRWVHRN